MERSQPRLQALLVLSLIAFVICGLCLLPTTSARANSWSPYCNNIWLGGWETNSYRCEGAPRTLHAEYGWGEQHSVCVANLFNSAMCSSGPGVGVYNPVEGEYWQYSSPIIANNAPGSNLVHASAEVP